MAKSNSIDKLSSTGERLMTEDVSSVTIEHLHRYGLASEYVKDKIVLDIASGEGYGSHILSKLAEKVIGVDISDEAISHAKAKYNAVNLQYICGSADKIPCDDGLFDIVVSFETIEHHDKHEEMMLEIKRVLKKDGILIMSSPDKLNYTDIPNASNEFHIKELYESEFRDLIKSHFPFSQFLKQRSDYLSFILPDNHLIEFTCSEGSFEGINKKIDYGPLYIIALASNYEIQLNNFTPLFYGSNVMQNEFNNRLNLLKNSMSYKIGKTITRPAFALRNLIKKLL